MTAPQIVADVMTKNVVTIPFDVTVHDALDLMIADRLTCVPVMSQDEKCIGILALPDLMRVASESEHMLNDASEDIFERMWVMDSVRASFGDERVHAYMTSAPVAINESASVGEAAHLMLEHSIHHLPVLNERGKIRGLVSSMDLLSVIERLTSPSVALD